MNQQYLFFNKVEPNSQEVLADKNLKNITYFNDESGFHFKEDYIYSGNDKIYPVAKVSLPGKHNLSNICAVLTVIEKLGINPKECVESIKHI